MKYTHAGALVEEQCKTAEMIDLIFEIWYFALVGFGFKRQNSFSIYNPSCKESRGNTSLFNLQTCLRHVDHTSFSHASASGYDIGINRDHLCNQSK
jgi:hypothetical protein